MLSWAIHLNQRQVLRSFQTMSDRGPVATTIGFFTWDFPWGRIRAPVSQRLCQEMNSMDNQQYLLSEPPRERQAGLAHVVLVNKMRT